jgi:hypothetical protein
MVGLTEAAGGCKDGEGFVEVNSGLDSLSPTLSGIIGLGELDVKIE